MNVDGPSGQISVSLVWMNDLQELFSHLPDGTRVRVASQTPPLAPGALANHTKHLFDL